MENLLSIKYSKLFLLLQIMKISIKNFELFLKSKIYPRKLNAKDNVSSQIPVECTNQFYQYTVGICGEFILNIIFKIYIK